MSGQLSAAINITDDIIAERWRQLKQWGEQQHQDGTSHAAFAHTRDYYRWICDIHAQAGTVTWKDILLEEVYEALAEVGPVPLRAELIQIAAVCSAWAECIDSRELAAKAETETA